MAVSRVYHALSFSKMIMLKSILKIQWDDADKMLWIVEYTVSIQ